MRSVVYDRFGVPAEVLRLEERPMPQPGPGQVRVKMRLSAIHNHDLMTIAGQYGIRPPLPAVPGTEAAGTVDALGEGVANLKVGQRVAGGASAMWADYYLAAAPSLIPLPDSVSDETACQLVAMPLSAWRLLAEMGLQPGDWIIQNAANGAVGKMLARRAAELGINTINLVRRDQAVAELAALGIANVVSTAGADWPARVAALAGGAPIVCGVDSIGGAAADALLSVMADKATLYVFGAMEAGQLTLSTSNVLFKRQVVRGFWGAKPSEILAPQQIAEMVGELVRRAATGALVLPVAESYALEEVRRAVAASGVPGRPGKIALRG